MNNLKQYFGILCFLVVSGCSTHSTVINHPVAPDQVRGLIANSPHVKELTDRKFEKRTSPESIQLFYYKFSSLNSPGLLKDWEYHYVVAPASSPEWPHQRLAEISVYLPARDDNRASATLREVASSIGGDGVVEIHRKPITTRPLPAPIVAYLYFGIVVRQDN